MVADLGAEETLVVEVTDDDWDLVRGDADSWLEFKEADGACWRDYVDWVVGLKFDEGC